MAEYYCRYYSPHGDVCTLYIYARNRDDAAHQCYHESGCRPFEVGVKR